MIAAARDTFSQTLQMLDARLDQSPFDAGPGFTIGDMPTAVIAYKWDNFAIKREYMPHLKGNYIRS